MTNVAATPRCHRTPGIAEATLDGVVSAGDRSHIAACATCRREWGRAVRFHSRLAATAAEVSNGIPHPATVAAGTSWWTNLWHTGRRLAPIATLAGAVALGLFVATIIGTRAEAPLGRPTAFSAEAPARQALGLLGLVCAESDIGFACQSTAPDHVHRVVMTLDDQRVIEVEARIESTNGEALEVGGADVLLTRIAAAVLAPNAQADVAGWLSDEFAACGTSCSAELDGLRLALEIDPHVISFSLKGR